MFERGMPDMVEINTIQIPPVLTVPILRGSLKLGIIIDKQLYQNERVVCAYNETVSTIIIVIIIITACL